MITLRIELPYAVFSVDVVDGFVTDTAPIARWMRGRPVDHVLAWVQGKGGSWMALGARREGG